VKLGDKIRHAATRSVRKSAKIDAWLQIHPDLRERLDEAAEVFAVTRTSNFGWRKFAKVLEEELPDFPPGYQHVQAWFQRTYPERFNNGSG